MSAKSTPALALVAVALAAKAIAQQPGASEAKIEHCVGCHGPDTAGQKAMNWNQQRHMDCVMCHADHSKSAGK